MQLKNRIYKIVVAIAAMIFAAGELFAQDGTQNVFTPYSRFGIGDFVLGGTSAQKGMGGTGIAVRSPFSMNTSNPAAFSAATEKTFLFSFGMQGTNNYLRSSEYRNSHNGFNMNDVSFMFRVAKKLGLGFSVTPLSSTGYKMTIYETNPEILATIGDAKYYYYGSGGISQFKIGLGWEVANGLSIGANFMYYLGSINDYSSTSFKNTIGGQSNVYRSITSTNVDYYNKVGGDIGVQYSTKIGDGKRRLTFGLTYQPKLNMKVRNVKTVLAEGTSSTNTNAIVDTTTYRNVVMPNKFGIGIAYTTQKMTLTADYEYQNWKNSFDAADASTGIGYNAYQDIRLGFEITPNRYDIRKPMKRWTYRTGVRLGTSYITHNGQPLREYGVSIGFGAPLQRGSFTAVNFGAEVGQRGSTKNAGISNTFARIFVGFNIFATQEWFIRHKFK